MDLLTGLIIAAVALIFLIALARGRKPAKPEALYIKRATLFTAAERSFLGVLEQAVSDQYRIFGKVRIADVITTAKGLDNSQRTSLLNRISMKHFDFVLCDPKTLAVVCALELNDSSHRSKRRAARDAFVRGVCESAWLPLLEVQAKRAYSVVEIREMVNACSKSGAETHADHELPET
tara:strand:+ start:10150 stop:10683 length:534 start_codon:yes stop_codon:yes gene_type:complete